MPIFDNYAPVVIQALQTRGLSGDCPMCKKNQWVVHEVPTSVPVYENSGQAVCHQRRIHIAFTDVR